MSESYGILRVVRVRLPVTVTGFQQRHSTGWLPEESLVHLLTQNETSIGRALQNDIILMDPTVSRQHARLIRDSQGWYIVNLTARNVVRVNGRIVSAGARLPLASQDMLVLGSTVLQFIAPQLPAPNLEGIQSEKAAENGHQASFTDALVEKELPAESATATTILPIQPEPEMQAQLWSDEEGATSSGTVLQLSWPQNLGVRTRWFIAGVGMTILTISAIVTITLNSLVGFSALVRDGASNLLAALTIPLIPAIGINILVHFIDRFEREPWYLRLAAFIWGAIIAIPPALFIEERIDALLQNLLNPSTSDVLRTMLQGLNAGVTEESIKGLGLLLLFLILRDQFDNVTDGIVYGALIGAGFAMVENFRYFASGSQQYLVFLIVGRIALGWLGHSTFTVCFGAALGYVRHTRLRWQKIVIPLCGYLIAVGLHSFFDFVDFQANAAILVAPANDGVKWFSLIAILGNYIPPFLAQMCLLYILIRALAHEAAIIREFLAIEVSNGVVSVDEYALLQSSVQRIREERWVLRRDGFQQWVRVRKLYQAEIKLAFRKWHMSMDEKLRPGYRQSEDAYRQRIKQLRQEIAQGRPEGTG